MALKKKKKEERKTENQTISIVYILGVMWKIRASTTFLFVSIYRLYIYILSRSVKLRGNQIQDVDDELYSMDNNAKLRPIFVCFVLINP